MEALVKTFKAPPGIEFCMVHDGSNGFGVESYAIQIRLRLPNGSDLTASTHIDAHQYAMPDGDGYRNLGVHQVMAALCGQIHYDYFVFLNSGTCPLDSVLNTEPRRKKVARAC